MFKVESLGMRVSAGVGLLEKSKNITDSWWLIVTLAAVQVRRLSRICWMCVWFGWVLLMVVSMVVIFQLLIMLSVQESIIEGEEAQQTHSGGMGHPSCEGQEAGHFSLCTYSLVVTKEVC